MPDTLVSRLYRRNSGTPGIIVVGSIPVPDTSVSSVRPQYRYPTLPEGHYTICRGYLPYRSCSVRPQYPTEQSGMIRYEIDTGTRQFGKFGTTSIPVPEIPVSSVRPPKISRVPVYPTEHTLRSFHVLESIEAESFYCFHVSSQGYVFGRVLTKVYRGYLLGKCPTKPFRRVRCGRYYTASNSPVRSGTNSISVPDTLVSSVRPQYRCSTLR